MDKKEELNINFNDINLRSTYLEYYIDNILNESIPDSVVRIFVGDNSLRVAERIIYFHAYPQEYLLVGLDANPCHIEQLYNRNLSEKAIYSRDALSDRELDRIEKRFRIEVLKKAKIYANQHNVP